MSKKVVQSITDMNSRIKETMEDMRTLIQLSAELKASMPESMAAGGESFSQPRRGPIGIVGGSGAPPPTGGINPQQELPQAVQPNPSNSVFPPINQFTGRLWDIPGREFHTPFPPQMPQIPFTSNPMLFSSYTDRQLGALSAGVPLTRDTASASDLAQSRVAQLSLGNNAHQGNLGSLVSQLQGGNNAADLLLADNLQKTTESWNRANQEINRLTDSLSGLDKTSVAYQSNLEELSKAVLSEKTAREQLTQAEKDARAVLSAGGSGTSGGGGPDSGIQLLKRMEALGAGLGMAGSLVSNFGNVYQAGMARDLGAETNIYGQAGKLGSLQAQRMRGVADFTSGENVLRYAGGFATGDVDDFSFLGINKRDEGRQLAAELERREINQSQRDLGFSGVSTGLKITGMLTGAWAGAKLGTLTANPLGIAAGTIFGAAGGAMLAGGAGLASVGMASQFGVGAANNEYLQQYGGLAGTPLGFMYGDMRDGMADRQRSIYGMNRMVGIESKFESLRDAEMQTAKAQTWVQGYDEMQSAIQARQQAAGSVGLYASDGLGGLRLSQSERMALQDAKSNLHDTITENTPSRFALGSSTGLSNLNIQRELDKMRAIDSVKQYSSSEIYAGAYTDNSKINSVGSLANFMVGRNTGASVPIQAPGAVEANLIMARAKNSGDFSEVSAYLNSSNINLSGEAKSILNAGYSTYSARSQERQSNISNATNMYNDTQNEVLLSRNKRGDWLGGMELSYSDFARYQNLTTGALSGGVRATDGMTAEMVRLGRSGLGSSEQLAGNLLSLQSVSGRQENFDNLKTIMSEAVSSGFDKAQLAQQFVSATTSLAQSLRTTATDSIASDLASGARLFGVGGQTSLLSLGEAQRGIGAFGAYTGQTGGLVGSIRAMSSFESGVTIGGGAGTMAEMNHYQLGTAMKELNAGKITDPNSERLIRVMASSRFGVSDPSKLTPEQRRELSTVINTQQQAALAPLSAGFSRQGADFGRMVQDAQSALNTGDTESLRTLTSQAYDLGTAIEGLGGHGASTAFMSQLDFGNNTKAMKDLERHIANSNSVFANPENQARQKFINNLTGRTTVDLYSGANSEQISEYFKAGGDPLRIRKDDGSGYDTVSDYKAWEELKTKDKAGQVTNVDLVRGLQAQISRSETGRDQGIDYISAQALESLYTIIRDALGNSQNMMKAKGTL